MTILRKLFPLLICPLLAACNLPNLDSGDDLNNIAATIAAMTLDSQNTPTQENIPLPTPTSVETEIPTPTITPTYSVPMLKVNEPTNCRTGPGQSFDIIFTLLPGASVEIVGRYPVNNYWVVKVDGLDAPCWAWGDYSTASGSTWTVPSVTPPATATPRPAAQPTNLTYTFFCSYNGANSDVSVTLNWTDKADDELGYRIYRNNELVAELPANSTSHSDQFAAESSQTNSFSVSAYNGAGESGRATISFSCQ